MNLPRPSILVLVLPVIAAWLAPAGAGEPLVLTVNSKRAIVNWDSWNADHERLLVRADRDDAIVIFRFARMPRNPEDLRVRSNAAVYIETGSGLVPISEKAGEKPVPKIDLKGKG